MQPDPLDQTDFDSSFSRFLRNSANAMSSSESISSALSAGTTVALTLPSSNLCARSTYSDRAAYATVVISYTAGASWRRNVAVGGVISTLAQPSSSLTMLKYGLRSAGLIVRERSASNFKSSARQASTSAALRSGDVVGIFTMTSGNPRSSEAKVLSACCHTVSSGESSWASSCGRTNGTSAPNFLATCAISASSVETTTRSREGHFRATSMAQPIKGLPASKRRFFLGTPLEPPLAQINPIVYGRFNDIVALCRFPQHDWKPGRFAAQQFLVLVESEEAETPQPPSGSHSSRRNKFGSN